MISNLTWILLDFHVIGREKKSPNKTILQIDNQISIPRNAYGSSSGLPNIWCSVDLGPPAWLSGALSLPGAHRKLSLLHLQAVHSQGSETSACLLRDYLVLSHSLLHLHQTLGLVAGFTPPQ